MLVDVKLIYENYKIISDSFSEKKPKTENRKPKFNYRIDNKLMLITRCKEGLEGFMNWHIFSSYM